MTFLTGPTLIYGLGRSGRGVARFLAREAQVAEWFDARPQPEDEALMTELGFARGDVTRPYRTVIAAPGVPIDHPDLQALREHGAEVMGEVEVAFRARPALPVVGVTGTAGKGSTTVLIASLLRAQGVNALEGGNIDPPLLDVVDRAEVAVAELSSFQLERVPTFRPAVAVVTNLGVDHLDRHGSVEAYHAAKRNVARHQTPRDVLVLPEGAAVPGAATVRRFTPLRLTLADGREVLPVQDLPEGWGLELSKAEVVKEVVSTTNSEGYINIGYYPRIRVTYKVTAPTATRSGLARLQFLDEDKPLAAISLMLMAK